MPGAVADVPSDHQMPSPRKAQLVKVRRVWKLDRSLKDLLHIMERIREAGAGFRGLTEVVDTTSCADRVDFAGIHVMLKRLALR
jgi:hypothetical protein